LVIIWVFAKISLILQLENTNMEKKATETTRDAKAFVKKWTGRGREKQDDKTFWEDLLESVFGVSQSRDAIEVQKPVRFNGTTKYIDVYIKSAGGRFETDTHASRQALL